jgi:methyl-accepting chemotaxis protein
MHFIANLKIGARLGLAFAITIAVTIGIAFYARTELISTSAQVKVLTQDRMVTVAQLASIKDNANVVARGVRNIILMSDADDAGKQSERKRIDDMRAKNADLIAKLSASIQTEEGKLLLKAVIDATGPYDSAMNKTISLGMANDDAAATAVLLKEVRSTQSAFFKAADALMEKQEGDMHLSATNLQSSAASASMVMLTISGLMAIFASVFSWMVTRSIVEPLKRAVIIAEHVAAGDLSAHIASTSADETGQLLRAMKTMNDGLIDIVSKVRLSSDSIATGSSEIATGSTDLSQRTEQQASNLQQTAASMEELTGAVKSSADTARQANEFATSAVAAARKGGDTVAQVVATMLEISASSNKISDIIGVIDGIAFQTNILALNAAVEAARAGEQGRGFAVVATEVRSLAQRSANAAKEIKALISNSVERVDVGTHQVDVAGHAMNDIVTQIQRVGGLISEISAAASEQTAGISQVGNAVAQLDQVTQQNAALVEQSTAAAQGLSDQATQLAQIVHVFKLS